MANREPRDAAAQDDLSGLRRELRAARIPGDEPLGDPDNAPPPPSDDAEVASEPMVLERLPARSNPPPGRQRTGDLPE
jgi:hypothetical protein